MLEIIEAESINEAFIKIAKRLKSNYDFVTYPRRTETKEIISCLIKINNPYDRIVTNAIRKLSLKYLTGEWLWYERGSNSLKEIANYSKFWKQITDDGRTINSSYGYRMLGKHPYVKINQWEYAKNQLINDKDSKRAIILICLPVDLKEKTNDLPCTMFLQFLIRNNYLHLFCNMRGNDLMLGFPYDAACFTMFQEKMLLELQNYYFKLKMGKYFHSTTNIEVYKRHYKLLQQIVQNEDKNIKVKMPKMRDLTEIKKLQYNERIIRTGSGEKLKHLNDKFCLWCQNILLNNSD